ncbi:MAG: Disulfide bond formation protein C [Chlamydiae bacterium]|nr:Disulfide bond formation protein C [Chlamydiota bacterium]
MRIAHRYTLYFAWLLVCVGTLISLYYSDIMHKEPCHLCWYQRICLFPLIFSLGIAAYRGFHGIAPYLLPQSILGLLIALYQICIQEIPSWGGIDICGSGPSCSEKSLIGLGPITFPMLSAAGFLILTLLLFTSLYLSTVEKLK